MPCEPTPVPRPDADQPNDPARRILIADDDATSRVMLAGILTRHGYAVTAVTDGAAAWDAMRRPDAPSIAILDWVMPELDGLEVCRRIRSLEAMPPPHVIILTALGDDAHLVAGLKAGADDYLSKPFKPDELLARVAVGERIVRMQSHLAREAGTDPLTELMNRAAIVRVLRRELSRALRDGGRVAVGLLDIDFFKRINDTLGHAAGDDVLREFARRCKSVLRDYDSLGRYGGEEFLVVAPMEAGAVGPWERLRERIASDPIRTRSGGVSVTVSIGVATGSGVSSPEPLIEAADAMLYRAKNGGRNRVVCDVASAGLPGAVAAAGRDPAAARGAPPARVAVVNDDPTQARITAGLLEKEGLAPRVHGTVEDALASFRQEGPPALIVTDLYMPGIDGWQFCRLLRSPDYEALNRVPVLVVSATFAGDEAERITRDLGANAFLPVPLDPGPFLDTVMALLRGERRRHRPRVLVVEDDGDLAGLLAETFRKHGYEADVAANSREAAAKFEAAPAEPAAGGSRYDVVILDYGLPDRGGDELLRRFREAHPAAVYVMTTGVADPALAVQWMRAGAAVCVRKPLDPVYLVDVCARACRERALLRVEALLEERTRELRQVQRLASIGTLAGGVAHEINNPVMGIMGFAELIAERASGDPETVSFAHEILRESERVAAIAHNLLSFARQETHPVGPVRFSDIIDAVLSLTGAAIGEDHIALEVHVPVDLPEFSGRSQRIQQVVMDLLSNARDALNEKYPGSHENKRIRVSAECGRRTAEGAWEPVYGPARSADAAAGRDAGLRVRLTVEDRGPGIPPSVREHIFDPFFTTKNRVRHAGLGLAISHAVVRDYGGALGVESEPGEWARFIVELPACAPADRGANGAGGVDEPAEPVSGAARPGL